MFYFFFIIHNTLVKIIFTFLQLFYYFNKAMGSCVKVSRKNIKLYKNNVFLVKFLLFRKLEKTLRLQLVKFFSIILFSKLLYNLVY